MHLFAGCGGGILGGMLLKHRPVVAVELDPFCRRVLKARQADGSLPPFPIHDDIRTFKASAWRGKVSIVSGGFPCQDVSAANHKAEGLAGARSSLWFEMLRVVSECCPRYVFIENSPAIRTRGLGAILEGLAGIGYDAAWSVLSAQAVGAPHVRKRMWILAEDTHANGERCQEHAECHSEQVTGQDGESRRHSVRLPSDARNADCEGLEVGQGQPRNSRSKLTPIVRADRGVSVADLGRASDGMAEWLDKPRRWLAGWDKGVDRVTLSKHLRTDRIKACGNGQVPLCVAQAFTLLRERLAHRD